jgi:hypothetical protein
MCLDVPFFYDMAFSVDTRIKHDTISLGDMIPYF